MRKTLVVGSGPSAIYFFKHFLECLRRGDIEAEELVVCDRFLEMGTGMPWAIGVSESFHLANIISESIPELPESLEEWMKDQDEKYLESFGIQREKITGDAFYPRIVVGQYFKAQYEKLLRALSEEGCLVREIPGAEVIDICVYGDRVQAMLSGADALYADRMLIATGHLFVGEDEANHGYYASPWPISKLVLDEGEILDFEVGILGASLSAFDVVSSLARRHGGFRDVGGRFEFDPDEAAAGFRIKMYSAEGWLPQLEYEEKKTTRKIYRYVNRGALSAMRDSRGFLMLDDFFAQVGRQELKLAAEEDGLLDLVDLLEDEEACIEDFVHYFVKKREEVDPFELLKRELDEAKVKDQMNIPTRWKEVFDDLIYCLNYHTEWMCYEDLERLKLCVFPFLLNVVAGLPIESAKIIMALHEVGMLELKKGKVEVKECKNGVTKVEVDSEGKKECLDYSLFIDCSGQGAVGVEEFPFQGLVEGGHVRSARARKLNQEEAELVGIDLDRCYRLVSEEGVSDSRLFDIAFPHGMGVRPYSFGLQSCSDAAAIVVGAWG